MQRRKFLGKSIIAAPAAIMLPSLLTSCGGSDDVDPIVTNKKILIIGAGMAGLAAARYFDDRGVSSTIIESQNRVGGRIKTDYSGSIPFDLGASWIHGPSGNPISNLASSANAATFGTDDDNVAVFDIDGSQYPDGTLDSAESEFDNILNNLSGSLNESFEDTFYAAHPQYLNDRLWTYQLSAYLEFDTGGDISKLSSLDFYDDEAFSGSDLIITNGYDKITESMKAGLDIRLDTQVRSIDYTNTLIKVTTSQGDFEADFVIVTIPLGVLKNNTVTFSPPLPAAKNTAISNVQMGNVNKFLCTWATPFWDTDLQYIGFTPESKGKFNYFLNTTKFSSANGLMTFAFGDYATTTENLSDSDITDQIMDHLKSIYGNNIPPPNTMQRTRWAADEHSFGAYSFASNGSRSSAFDTLAEPVNNRLFFAGEHTSRDYRGTVHGAFLSGEREARKVANLL
jgi:monoamine oxidase